MDEQQTCPRRLSDFGPWERTENLDTWTTGHGLIGQDQVGPSCSFCGSLHPDRFIALVREGWIVGPTDKSYKVYFARPYTADEVADRKRRWLEADTTARAIRDLGGRDGKTPEQIDADLEQQWARLPSQDGATVAKFYLQHLSEAQRDEFIDLVNNGQMKIGYPGRFYRLPFFAKARAEQ